MVIHSPHKFEVRPVSSASGTPAVQQPPTTTTSSASGGSIPASVLAASAAAPEGDLLGAGAGAVQHDFDAWQGGFPPGSSADRFSEREEHVNVTTRTKKVGAVTSGVDDAGAADAVVLESRATDSDRSLPAISQLSLLDDDGDLGARQGVPPPMVPVPAPLVAAASRRGAAAVSPASRKSDNLCLNHARWGKETYRCLKPQSCRMRRVLRPKPPQQQEAPGNVPAGGRQ